MNYGIESIAIAEFCGDYVRLTITYAERPARITIGRHTFTFDGPADRYEAWRRHLERCRRDYEVRLAIREAA